MKKIRLQGIGWYNAIEAKDLVVGDVILHNFGYTSTVTNISKSKSGKTINYHTITNGSGYEADSRTTPSRLFAVKRMNS